VPKKERRRNMHKLSSKILAITTTMLLLISAFNIVFINRASSSLPVIDPIGIDEDIKDATLLPSEDIEPSTVTHHSYWEEGDYAIWTYYWSGAGVGLSWYELVYIGTDVEIWVEYNIAFPAGDPRNAPDTGMPTKPTYAQCQYLADEFEQNILPKESAFFGAPDFHDGSNAILQYLADPIPDDPEYYYEPTGRAVILVCNIVDDNYFDYTYPYFVIGVHISTYEDVYYDRNVVTLDAVSWFHALGDPGTNWGSHWYWPDGIYHDHPVTSPYAYDSTLAHEWQHLLHHELSPGDVAFMNEGCSMYAELLCGYGIDPDYMNSYFATPDNSLTVWGDQGGINILADYGVAALWCIYLADRYGAEFLQIYFWLGGYGIHGIEAIDYALYFTNHNERFPEVYRDWKVANLVRADYPGAGRYNYKSINLNDPAYDPIRVYDVSGFPVPPTTGMSFGNTITILGYDTGISAVSSWGSDYVGFTDWERQGFMYFDGDDNAIVPPPSLWTMTDDGWYSGTGVDLADEMIVDDAYVDPLDPTLTLVSAYYFEDWWDFGFVQVSTDAGATWTSLANEYTTTDHDPSAHPDIVASLPGLTGESTGFPGWLTMSFDLSAYAGQNIMVGFRYMTDWVYTEAGWLINSATVSGAALTLTPFVPTINLNFQVTMIKAVAADGQIVYIPYDMRLNSETNSGKYSSYSKIPIFNIMIVTPIMNKGTADYEFRVNQMNGL